MDGSEISHVVSSSWMKVSLEGVYFRLGHGSWVAAGGPAKWPESRERNQMPMGAERRFSNGRLIYKTMSPYLRSFFNST